MNENLPRNGARLTHRLEFRLQAGKSSPQNSFALLLTVPTVLLTLCLFLIGCKTTPLVTAPAPATVTEINLLTTPIAMNYDADPEPDGFGVKVYANKASDPKFIQITQGVLELVVYEGVLESVSPERQPLQTWRYTPAHLKSLESLSSLGARYDFILLWDTPPSADRVSVIAKYTPPSGKPIYSAPSSISVAGK